MEEADDNGDELKPIWLSKILYQFVSCFIYNNNNPWSSVFWDVTHCGLVATDVSGLPVGSILLKVEPVVCSETSGAAYVCCIREGRRSGL